MRDPAAIVTVTGAVPVPLAGDTRSHEALVVAVQAAVPDVRVTISLCPGVFDVTVVPDFTAPNDNRARSTVYPPPLGGGSVVGIVVETSLDGALRSPDVFSA